jgi:hypothetical protein
MPVSPDDVFFMEEVTHATSKKSKSQMRKSRIQLC